MVLVNYIDVQSLGVSEMIFFGYFGSKKSTVGYCMVLLGTTGYWVVLGCTGWGEALVGTEGTGGFWGYSVVPEGALENYWVLGLLGRTGGT